MIQHENGCPILASLGWESTNQIDRGHTLAAAAMSKRLSGRSISHDLGCPRSGFSDLGMQRTQHGASRQSTERSSQCTIQRRVRKLKSGRKQFRRNYACTRQQRLVRHLPQRQPQSKRGHRQYRRPMHMPRQRTCELRIPDRIGRNHIHSASQPRSLQRK